MQIRTLIIVATIGVVLAILLGLGLSYRATGDGAAGKTHAVDHRPQVESAAAPTAGTALSVTPKHTADPITSSASAVAPAKPRPTVMTEHPTLRVFIDKSASPRFTSDFETRVPTVSDPDDLAWVLYVLDDHTDLDAVRNEAANLLRRSHVRDVDQHLLAVLASPLEKERFRSYAVQHLGDLMRELLDGTKADDLAGARTIQDALAKALTDPYFMVRSEALMALARERDPRANAIIRSGLTDPQWSQGQDLLIRCAKEAGLTDLIPTIRPLAYSTNDVVRIAAVNVLAQWRDEASRPAFEEASRSAVPRLQRAGTLALTLMEKPQ